MISGSYEGTLSSGDVSTETSASKANFRQATFSIDSVDSFSPGSLPGVIAEFGGVSLTELATVGQTAPVEVEEGNDDAVLDDPALTVTSILRKLGCQIGTVEGRASREDEQFLESVRFVV